MIDLIRAKMHKIQYCGMIAVIGVTTWMTSTSNCHLESREELLDVWILDALTD
jgi:hypothetical protein